MGVLEVLLGGALVGALTFYLLTGGADFGAGIWSLFAFGRDGQKQRALIDEAIGPIWEANHVWLIVAVTILFTAFPPAFAAIATGLHIPLSIMLIGIVLRGTAFAVRTQDIASRRDGGSTTPVIWRYLFAGSSVITPILLGVSLGAIASGRLAPVLSTASFTERFVNPWLAPFPLSVGVLTMALVAYLAAAYLLVEARDPEVRTLFARRAMASGLAVVLAAAIARRGGGSAAVPCKDARADHPVPEAADSHPLRTHCRGYDAPSIPFRGPPLETWSVIFQPRQVFVNASGPTTDTGPSTWAILDMPQARRYK